MRRGKKLSWTRITEWLVLAFIAALFIGGAVRARLLEPEPADVQWLYDYNANLDLAQVVCQPGGGLIVRGRTCVQFLTGSGELVAMDKLPVNNLMSIIVSQVNAVDSEGNYYLCYENEVRSYTPDGQLRWIATLPLITDAQQDKQKARTGLRVSGDDHIYITGDYVGVCQLDTAGVLVRQLNPQVALLHTPPLELPSGLLLCAADVPKAQNASQVVAFTSAGEIAWQADLDSRPIWRMEMAGSNILIMTGAGSIHMLDEDGQQLWEYACDIDGEKNIGIGSTRVCQTEDGTLLVCSLAELVCLDGQGRLRWRFRGDGLMGVVATGPGECYVISCHEGATDWFGGVLKHLNQQAYLKYVKASRSPYLVKLVNGKVAKRWSLSCVSTGIHGPSPDGELYIDSMLDRKVCCVRVE